MKLSNIVSGVLTGALALSICAIAYAEVQNQKELNLSLEYQEQHQCLAMNIYHEARGDSALGQKAVGFVTMNRVYDPRYPNTVCDVVYDAHVDSRGNPLRNKCQFSWYCDGKSDTPRSKEAWQEAERLAGWIMRNYGIVDDYTDGAVMYHASYVNPYWAPSYQRTVRIDTHIFYK